MSKQFSAFIVASVITLIVAAGLLLIGGAVYFNQNGTHLQNTNVSTAAPGTTNVSSQEVAQLQSLVQQYQEREKEYQAREQQYQQELASANQQLQMDQQQFQQVNMLLVELQQRGVITVSDGRVFINQ